MEKELAEIIKILADNADKSFVKRVMNPKNYGVLKNPDGSISTHSMSWGEDDQGKVYVYPTVLMEKDGSLRRYSDNEAWRHTQATGNFIEFPSREKADWFTKNYKRIWKGD